MPANSHENIRKKLINAADEISAGIASGHQNFKLHTIFFRRGQKDDELQRFAASFTHHPCENSIRDLLRQRHALLEVSGFIGIATGNEKALFGLRKTSNFIGISTINLDACERAEDGLFEVYHAAAQALDTFRQLNIKNFRSRDPEVILQPTRNQLSLARSNLQSDVFSALVAYRGGIESATDDLALRRARKALTPQAHYRPEDYPFIIATDVMNYTLEHLFDDKSSDDTSHLFHLARKIAFSFDKHNLKSWAGFAGPAQTMAWNGYSEEKILGAAISTSSDPFIKATANLLSEITGIRAVTGDPFSHAGNPFNDEASSKALHKQLSEQSFEAAIMHAIEAESSLPLIRSANNQNEALLKGRIAGWCADALQSSAKTFETTLKKGLPPAPASRIEFQRLAGNTDWKSLNELNQHMVTQRRQGRAMTFSEISQWCSSRFDLRPVVDSVQMTLSDPEYERKIAMVNDMPRPASTPQPAAAPTMTPNTAPSMGFSPGFSAGMGMGMRGSGIGGSVRPSEPLQPARQPQEGET